MALALITTTFAGISSAGGDEDGMLVEWTWDKTEGELTIIPTHNLNTTNFSYDVSFSNVTDGVQQFYVEEADIPTEPVSVITNLSDGYYDVQITVWNENDFWGEDLTLCIGETCSNVEVDISFDEATMMVTWHVYDAYQGENITAMIYDINTGGETEFFNVTNGDMVDISGYEDGEYCFEIMATLIENGDEFKLDWQDYCLWVGEESTWPWMDINYDEATMNLSFDVYDLPVNTSLEYQIHIVQYDGMSAKFDQIAEFESNSSQWSIYIDVGVEFDPTNYSYGMYWASLDIWTDAGDHVIGDGTEICYGDQTDCEEVEEMFICDNGEEIPLDYYDDGEDDCGDGSDEPNGTGNDEKFICDNGEAIPMSWYDDGEDDCGDGSDEPNGTGDGGDDIEIASLDIDIWFEQWTNSKMEFVLVQSMVIDDAESIAMYTMMADSFFGNDDGEVTQDEVNLLLMMMSEESLEDFDMTDEMQLDGATGMLVDAWMDVKGLVEGDSEITMVMGQVVSFQTTPYADSTTHTFTFTESADADGDGLADGVDNDCDGCNDADGDGFDHTCEVDGIWIHNSDTWSVSSITTTDADGGTPTLNFEYDGYNDAWFSADCPDKSEEITFILEKTDIGELPDPNDTNNPIIDWEEMDTNKLPMCAYAYAVVMADGTFDTRAGIDTAPESGDYIIDLMDGAEYKIYVVCIDPEGKEMTVTISNADLNLTSTYTATAEAEASLLLSVPTGYDGTYTFDVTWTDGHHTESGTLTVNGMGDGTGGDLEADGDGFLPGFTAALGIVALLGAAMISSRRN